jgi:hypothetical protein
MAAVEAAETEEEAEEATQRAHMVRDIARKRECVCVRACVCMCDFVSLAHIARNIRSH